ncbi:LacI family DNA-binding transcriptional regulator [Liquorilactobacillus satsumensis]|uniref:Transcriptional regulator n=1 Tax=Liquorilactobacillus satsumensis DSM 16230 = JCM 12392 TaxID=1423801 RepID=A0A0R1V335_9LACO|nr:LacI family DNA-binding transcriptional regulator [Liquorilactobacillus satsumensis]KRL97157.1 transcriptional regulator [Liquorilactobacillus satsumensis DSM 16230 = JCM 12392]MCC7667782.1 LacI family transcriptional regulator [Liquorilactobacillus satsumensis]MCP9311944.1 LacI family DNA-binding transcriptional regulator [Liquorilactobacillus satsumensis]MCP9328582.1 LacI family DNA-binding transcriptional regulator [Liquorilactobacillus satsumensis]MCP9356889.1 LacI family DNA-binding tr
MQATIKDIAKATGFSVATVSRVLSNKKGFFSEKTAAKVNQVAKELGYKKNMSATELVTKKSNVIAALINSTKTNFSDSIIKGIQDKADELGKTVIILYAGDRDARAQKKALTTALERSVAGILLLSVDLSPENLTLLKSARTPFYFISITFQDTALPCITSNDHGIGYLATSYLIRQGHRRIGLAGLDFSDSYTGKLRLAGYQAALAENQLSAHSEWVQAGDYSYEAGIAALDAYAQNSELPITAVIAGSDMVGIGILNRASALKIPVPQKLSIVTIDGTDLCRIVQPPLTSVTQDFYKMGYVGLERLLENAAGITYTQSELTERKSVLAVKK